MGNFKKQSLQLIHGKEYLKKKQLEGAEKNVMGNMCSPFFSLSREQNQPCDPRVLHFSHCVTNWDLAVKAFNTKIKQNIFNLANKTDGSHWRIWNTTIIYFYLQPFLWKRWISAFCSFLIFLYRLHLINRFLTTVSQIIWSGWSLHPFVFSLDSQ